MDHELVLVEHLSIEFAPLHVAKPGKIETTVRYQGSRHVDRAFRAAATIAKVTRWAVCAFLCHHFCLGLLCRSLAPQRC